MSLRCIILKINICICFIPSFCLSQEKLLDSLQFYHHLKQNHLFEEQLVFNKNIQKRTANPTVMDSLQLDVAAIYFQQHLSDSCKNTLLKISNIFNLSKKQNQQYLSMLLINKEFTIVEKTINDARIFDTYSKSDQNDMVLSVAMLKKELNKNDSSYNSFSVSPVLFELKSRYLNPPDYSPVLAGLYSAAIPGLGKWYIGNKNQAITAFIANILLGAQAAESYFKCGFHSPRFIITTGIFSIFYTGNIIGSISIAKKKKTDYFKQIDYEIFDYYSSSLNK